MMIPNPTISSFSIQDFRRLYEFEFLSLVEHIWWSDFLFDDPLTADKKECDKKRWWTENFHWWFVDFIRNCYLPFNALSSINQLLETPSSTSSLFGGCHFVDQKLELQEDVWTLINLDEKERWTLLSVEIRAFAEFGAVLKCLEV
jgi:hypothetical protein